MNDLFFTLLTFCEDNLLIVTVDNIITGIYVTVPSNIHKIQ